MKKRMVLVITALLLCTSFAFTGCSGQNASDEKSSSAAESTAVSAESTEQSSEQSQENSEESSSESSEGFPGTVSFETTDEKIQESVNEVIDNYQFEGVVYIEKAGKPVAAFCKATLDDDTEVTMDTPVPIGSTSKQFCAVSVLLLQDQGKLKVEDTIDKYYPEYKYGNKITIKHLLSMTSGIPTYNESLNEYISPEKSAEENGDGFYKWIFDQKLGFEPGEGFLYSNGGYYLLSGIVEQVSGEDYKSFVRKNIFTPVGMEHTGFISELQSSPEWAGGTKYNILDDSCGATRGAGDMVSTGSDITKWLSALSSGKVISDESYKQMITDYAPSDHYGFGFYLEMNGGCGHPGAIDKYRDYDYINVDKDYTMYMWSNNIDTYANSEIFYALLDGTME